MKILVTGASGFVGSFIAKRLIEDGENVIGVTRTFPYKDNISYYGLKGKMDVATGDLTDSYFVERTLNHYQPNLIIHFAAMAIVKQAQENPTLTFKSNIQGTWTLLEATRKCSSVKGFIGMSTDKIYGEGLDKKETDVINPQHPYAVSKACVDMLVRTYLHTYDLPAIVVRPCNIFGPGDWHPRIVPNIIKNMLLRKPLLIFEGDDKMFRQYIDLDTLYFVFGLLIRYWKKMKAFPYAILNIATDHKPISTEAIVKMIGCLHPKAEVDPLGEGNVEFKVVKRAEAVKEISEQSLDITRLKALFAATDSGPWRQPEEFFKTKLKETINWYDEHRDYWEEK